MRRKTWPSLAALFACLLIAVHAENGVDDALQPNFLPSSGARNSLGGIFVEEKATVHAEEGSAAKLLAEIEAQEASSSVVEDDGPPAISHHDAESLTHTLMAALRGADPTEAFHEMAAANAADAAAAAEPAAPEQQEEQEEAPALPSFLQQKESASAARMASMVGNTRVEVEDDKAEDISQDSEEDKEEEEEHPDPFGLHHAADAPQAAAPAAGAASSAWPNYYSPAMYAQQGTDAAANDRFKQQMAYNPYALYAAYFQQFAQAAQPHHKKHHHHHHEEEEEQDAHTDKPASPNAPASDAMRFKEKEHASHDEDDDGDADDDGDDEDGDADDDGDDDDDDGEERRRRERKRKQEQQKLKYDDGMNKARFEQINLDIENMKSFTSPRQSGYSAPVDSTPVSTPAAPAAIPLGNPAPYHPLFNAPAQPQSFQAAAYPQAIPNPGSAPAYPSLLAISQQAMPQASATNANPNGVPMPYFPPTSAPPPAPNQVPVAAQTVNGVYPPSMVMPSTAAMPFAADGMTQSPAVNPSAPTMNPNAPSAPGLSNYPFGGTNFLELESVPLPSSAIHAHVDAIARHPRHPNVRSRLTEQHFEEFPLLQ